MISLSPALRKISASIDKVIFCANFGDLSDLSQQKVRTTTATNQIRIFYIKTIFSKKIYVCLAKSRLAVSTVLSPPVREVSPVRHDSTYPTCVNPSNQPVHPSSGLQQHPPHVHETQQQQQFLHLPVAQSHYCMQCVTLRSSFSFFFTACNRNLRPTKVFFLPIFCSSI